MRRAQEFLTALKVAFLRVVFLVIGALVVFAALCYSFIVAGLSFVGIESEQAEESDSD